MVLYPAIKTLVQRIHDDVIGGAADTAKEVAKAISAMIYDSQAESPERFAEELQMTVVEILKVTPSFAPPINALHRVLGCLEEDLDEKKPLETIKADIQLTINDFLTWAESALEKVAHVGAELINDGDTVFMYSMSSTVWRILRSAKKQNKSFNVIVTESRPMNEGLWTVDEMLKIDVLVSASIDACIGELIPESNIVFVGADAISSHGFAFCKAGTYPSALVAKAHGVPFYVAADTLKFDTSTLLGLPFKSDPVPFNAVLEEKYSKSAKVVGELFDQTPPNLITGIVTEIGLLHPTACVTTMWNMKLSRYLNSLLPSWSHGEL